MAAFTITPPPTNLQFISPEGRVNQAWADWFYRLVTLANQVAPGGTQVVDAAQAFNRPIVPPVTYAVTWASDQDILANQIFGG